MKISDELKEKIENMFKNNEDIKKGILSGESEVIQKIGIISQKGIEAEEIVKSYENNTIDSIYKKAKKLVEMQEIYKELCTAYYTQRIKDKEQEER